MAEFILNPRRAPRAPARCRAAVASSGWTLVAETEDIGSMGCQIVSTRLVRRGEQLRLAVSNPKVAETLEVVGLVAWVSPQAPWRVGIAFDERFRRQASHWFDLLITAYPGLGGFRRVPDRISADTTVYLGPPPKFLVDFTAEEAMLLRAIASGARVDELQARLRASWPAAQRALFSLIARQAVTLQRGQAVHPDSWKKILSEVEASLALEEMGRTPATPVVAPPAPVREAAPTPVPSATPVPDLARARRPYQPGWPMAEPQDPSPQFELAAGDDPPLEVDTPAEAPAGRRSAEAQAAFGRALAELRDGSVAGAIALLRRALALAPGDPEIASELGKLAFRDRR